MSEPQLQAALARPALAPLVAELARRFGASDRPVTSVTVNLDTAGREALADLLGLERLPTAISQVSVARLAAATGVSIDGVRAVVETIFGPVGNRAASTAAARAELEAATDAAAAAAQDLGDGVAAWAAAALRALPGPVADRRAAVVAVIDVVAAKRPHPRPLAVAAAEVFADPHALDAGTRNGELLGACCAAAVGMPAPRNAEAWRTALGRFGLTADEVASAVTVWRLMPQSGHPLVSSMIEHVRWGEPAVWTLSMLRRWPVTVAPERVLVVENPSVLAVAAADGFDGTVVCASGRPSVAVTVLVAQLAAAGARIDVHADFDEAGLGIVAGLTAGGAHPFLFGAEDYLTALELAGPPRAVGMVPATPWDPELADAYRAHRRPVYEEQLVDVLLA